MPGGLIGQGHIAGELIGNNYSAIKSRAVGALTGAGKYDIDLSGYSESGRNKFDKITANRVKQVSEEPVSTFSMDVIIKDGFGWD